MTLVMPRAGPGCQTSRAMVVNETAPAAPRSETRPNPSAPRWRSVALPPEYGSWGLVAEPVVLGLLVAASWPSFLVALGAVAAFLAYRPAKIAYGDLGRGKRYPRTVLALRFAAGFAGAAGMSLVAAYGLAGPGWTLPFALAAPFGTVFVVYDLRPGRSWQVEVTAPVAFASTSAAMATAAGWSLAAALALWAVMAGRALLSVLYVRARLHLERGEPTATGLALGVHLAALTVVTALAVTGLLPWLAAVALLALLARAAFGLSHLRRPTTPRVVGFGEIAWGAVTVLLVAAGYWLGV